MSARIHGFTLQTLAPGPDLYLTRDAEGKTTAQRSFTCLKSALHTSFIQSKIKKGTAITELCSDIPSDFQHLLVDSNSSRDAPGGFTTIDLTFTGYTESGEFSFDQERTYSLRGSLAEVPIIEHPNYLKKVRDVTIENHKAIVALYHGRAFVANLLETTPEVRDSATQEVIAYITDSDALKWYTKIHIDGVRTYLSPSYEWTEAKANAGGLASSEINKFGKKDSPPGNPPTPDGEGWWQMMDLDDTRSSNASSNSITWRFIRGKVDADLYDYED